MTQGTHHHDVDHLTQHPRHILYGFATAKLASGIADSYAMTTHLRKASFERNTGAGTVHLQNQSADFADQGLINFPLFMHLAKFLPTASEVVQFFW